MKFLVLMAEEDTWNRWNALSEAEQQAVFDCFTAFTAAVEERGKVIAGDALDRPELARTVRPGAERPVTEGPFAETVEQMGGFWVVDLPDLETAVAAARLLPEAYSVEVRPDRRHRRLTQAIGCRASRTPGATSGAACWPCSSPGTDASTSPRTASATPSRPPPVPGRPTAPPTTPPPGC